MQQLATRNRSLVGRVSQIPRLMGLRARVHQFRAASSFLFLFHTRLPPTPLPLIDFRGASVAPKSASSDYNGEEELV